MNVKRLLLAVFTAALIGALLLPGRFTVDIHFGLSDVVNSVGMAVILAGVFLFVMVWKKDDR